LFNSSFFNTISDALDVDYGKGEISGCVFNQIGNDGIDISFSEVTASNNKLKNIKDKGISCGEKSKLNIYKTDVVKAKVGIIIKDESIVILNEIKIKEADYGVVLFNKKATFNTPKASVNNVTLNGVKVGFLIDKKAILNKGGKQLKGNTKIDVKQFN
jgi:hypothetical protein